MKVNMRKPSVIAGILMTGGAMLMTTAALARGPGGGEGPEFSALDANSDGVLTAAEFEAAKAGRLGDLDANSDGFITADEMLAQIQARQAEHVAERFEKMLERADADDDGRLSVDELAAMAEDRGPRLDDAGFPRGWDSDGDGVVSQEEFETAMEDHKGRHGGRRGHGGG